MATICKWYPLTEAADIPGELLTGSEQVDPSKFTGGDAAIALVGTENYGKIKEAVLADLIASGASKEVGYAYLAVAQISVAAFADDRFALVVAAPEYEAAFAGIYKMSCGEPSKIFSKVPWMILGAGVLGLTGFFVGSRWNKGKGKDKKKGMAGIGSMVGAAVGATAGLGAGLLLANVTIPSMFKGPAGLGAPVRRMLPRASRICPAGMVYAPTLHRCVRPL